jgi:hypothetical protein
MLSARSMPVSHGVVASGAILVPPSFGSDPSTLVRGVLSVRWQGIGSGSIVTVRRLFERRPLDELRLLRGRAVAHARVVSELEASAIARLSPAAACAHALPFAFSLQVAAALVEDELRAPSCGGRDRPREVREAHDEIAQLVMFGEIALNSHAQLHGYRPDVRLARIDVHAGDELEIMSRLRRAGGTNIFVPAVSVVFERIGASVAPSTDDPVDFVDAVTRWSGAALAIWIAGLNDAALPAGARTRRSAGAGRD